MSLLQQLESARKGREARAHEPLRSVSRLQGVRRGLTFATVIVGLGDLWTALLPPSRRHLTFLLRFVPLVVAQGAGVLLALCGLVLLATSWGLRRGQRRAWGLSCLALSVASVLHLAHGIEAAQAVISIGLLVLLVIVRQAFCAPGDRRTWGSVVLAGIAAVLGTVGLASASIEVLLRLHRGFSSMPVHLVLLGVAERMAGIELVGFAPSVNRFVSPTLLGVGLSLVVMTALAISRPFVDRRLRPNPSSQEIARRLVSDHGGGTLDYFALRHDKWHYITRRTLVTYAVHGSVCLVSPDPIGPLQERELAWAAFCEFADSNGWTVAVLAAEASRLEVYKASGMRSVYVGDEAIVNVKEFSLAGGQKKGLRQAVQRIERHGYEVSFHDPRHLDEDLAASIRGLMAESRRGQSERGFSMTLGRLLDPNDTGLLLAVAHGPGGDPVAFCQFVPAPAIDGYSLDVMRRARGAHPNGLIDFLLVSTIKHLKGEGHQTLSLNFAALRAYVAGEHSRSLAARLLKVVLRRVSSGMQVESLWRFTAKYDPEWSARYVAFGSAMHLPSICLAIAKAESLWEIPIIGRFLAKRSPGDGAVTGVEGEPEAA